MAEKTKKWDSKGNMIVESGWKLFDKQSNYIGTGNVWATTQYSSFIRPYSDVVNGGYIASPGDFLKFDMKAFKEIPFHIKDILLDKSRSESVCLYEFFVHIDGNREPFAYLLTDYHGKWMAEHIICRPRQCYAKRVAALNECKKYICA